MSKTKRSMQLISAILAILTGIVLLVLSVLFFLWLNDIWSGNMTGTAADAFLVLFFGLLSLAGYFGVFALVAVGVMMIVLGGICCRSPGWVDGKYKSGSGRMTALLIFFIPALFMTIVASIVSKTYVWMIFLPLVGMVSTIVTLCLKHPHTRTEQTAEYPPYDQVV